MKLHEIAKPRSGHSYEDLTVETEGYGKLKLRVEYDWEDSYSDRHGDNASFDEHHAGGADVTGVTLRQDVKEFDEDGEETDEVVKSGTDASKLKYWDKWDDEAVQRALDKHFEDQRDDYDPY